MRGFFLSVLTLAAFQSAYAQDRLSLFEADDAGTINVSATGYAEREPDHFIVVSSFELRLEDRTNLTERLEDYTDLINRDIPRIKGIEGLRIETMRLGTDVEFSKKCQPGGPLWGKKASECLPIGFNAKAEYRIQGSPADKAGDVIALLEEIENSENSIRGYFYEDHDEALQEAREKAIAKALSKVKTLATGAGVNVGKIILIKEGFERRGGSQPMYALAEHRSSGTEIEDMRRSVRPQFNFSIHPKRQEFFVPLTLTVEIEQ